MIAITSINFYSEHLNYGAAIHNLAFQLYLKRKGKVSIVLDYYPKWHLNKHFLFPILYLFRRPLTLRNVVYKFINWGVGWLENVVKYCKFKHFFRTYYKKTKIKIHSGEEKFLESIDGQVPNIWCVVSDVIWKLELGFDPVFFLDFPLAKKARKVAYTPSMGARPMHELPDGMRALQLVKDFDAISVREREGAAYLSEQLDRKIECLIDPTLLLDSQDYEDVISIPKRLVKQKYVLIYNCMVNDVAMCKLAEVYAERHGLIPIEVSVFGVNRYPFRHMTRLSGKDQIIRLHHKVIASAGIEEWLSLIKNAEKVFTNSFHGACFSVIFKKDFLCFQRNETDYKMQNFMRTFDLENWFVACNEKKIREVEEIDYDVVYEKLALLRAEAEEFIDRNILQPHSGQEV